MKRNALSVLCVILFAALLTLTACGDGRNGTYYNETGELYIRMRNGTWSMGEAGGEEALSGPYVTESGSGVISFRSAVTDGESLEIFTGELDGNRLTVYFQGEADATVFYRNGEG